MIFGEQGKASGSSRGDAEVRRTEREGVFSVEGDFEAKWQARRTIWRDRRASGMTSELSGGGGGLEMPLERKVGARGADDAREMRMDEKCRTVPRCVILPIKFPGRTRRRQSAALHYL